MSTATKHAVLGSAVLLMIGLAACGDDGDDASGDAGSAISASVVPTDGDLEPDPTSAAAGSVVADNDARDDGGSAETVSVVLTDGGVIPDPPSADAGSMEFLVQNVGGDLHNFVIVRGDDPAALPVDEDGAVIEAALPEGDLIGRIDAVDAGTEESTLFDLDAGAYILFCNIVVPSAVPPLPVSHFEDGMVATFTVT